MNPEAAEPQLIASSPPAEGWGEKKILLVVALAFAVHFGFIYLLGEKKQISQRTVKNIPVFQLAAHDELVRLTDPTLFVLPHAEDFTPVFWSRPPAVESLEFRWTEPPSYLALTAANLGAVFDAFMHTYQLEKLALNFKPEPQLSSPEINVESALPQNSSWQLAGELAGRRILNSLTPSSQAVNDVIAPSRAQLLVAPDGNVLSVVLLESSGLDAADQQALTLARSLQFAPAKKLMFGEIIFNWHTVPAGAP
jgi:TonB family protein